MSENTVNVLAAVDSVLGGKELKDQPRAFLLLRLCQLSLLVSPDQAESYWNRLAALQSRVPQEAQTDLQNLRAVVESTSTAEAKKGFAAEVMADIEAARKTALSDAEGAKRLLHECEERLNKRRWPFGKTPVQIVLVETWASVDRLYALQLIGTIPANVRESLLRRMNQARVLTAEEWQIVADKVGMDQAAQIVLKMLDDDQPRLILPGKAVLEVGTRIRNSMKPLTTAQQEGELVKAFKRYSRLTMLQAAGEQADLAQTLVEEVYVFLAQTSSLEQIWSVRFSLLATVLELGVTSKGLTDGVMERLLAKTPAYLAHFARAHYAALTASPEQVEQAYTALLNKTGQNHEAEAWFLATQVVRGNGAQALALARRSPQAGELLPRLRRAWLCTHPESAASAIAPADMAGDPIGEFLAQGAVAERVAYLSRATDGGKRSVPGAMWAGMGTEEGTEGVRGFWQRLTTAKKSSDQIIVEYLALNPLYSSYRTITKKEEQFANHLRITGYGEYRYTDTDNVLLQTLVAWGDQNASEVRSVLHAMWNAIRPDENILMVDWLRNAILTRCRNVFAADADVLEQDFLAWFKRELVDKGRVWRSGNMQYTLKYADTSVLQFCITSALAVNPFSPACRDRVLLMGLRKFKADPAGVEAAAQVYNSDKQVLDLNPPLELKPPLLEAWQMGIVKNAIPHILTTMLAHAGGG